MGPDEPRSGRHSSSGFPETPFTGGPGFAAPRYEPGRFLGIIWYDGEVPGPESEVLFELEPAGEGTLLTLRHRKISTRETLASVGSGWHTHLDILEAILYPSASFVRMVI